MIKLETKHAFLKENVKDYQESVDRLHQQLMNKECLGNDYVGWVEWPNTYDQEEFARIKQLSLIHIFCVRKAWCRSIRFCSISVIRWPVPVRSSAFPGGENG